MDTHLFSVLYLLWSCVFSIKQIFPRNLPLLILRFCFRYLLLMANSQTRNFVGDESKVICPISSILTALVSGSSWNEAVTTKAVWMLRTWKMWRNSTVASLEPNYLEQWLAFNRCLLPTSRFELTSLWLLGKYLGICKQTSVSTN